MHDFQKSLQLSHEYSNAPWWMDVYRKAFPDLQSAVYISNDGWAQRGGIDRVLTLASGKTLLVDDKVRAEDWPDILLEYWSDEKRKIKGWVAKDLACDFIAYAFIPSQTCYMLPFQTLRSAWRKNCKKWVRSYKRIEAQNKGYVTVSVAVPTKVLLESLSDSMVINWREE